MVVDPIEETYPFSGNVEFLHPDGNSSAPASQSAEHSRGLPRQARGAPGGAAAHLRESRLGHQL